MPPNIGKVAVNKMGQYQGSLFSPPIGGCFKTVLKSAEKLKSS